MGRPSSDCDKPLTQRKHIVVIPSWYLDGRGAGGGYFRDQALALQAAGHRVAMLVPEIYTARDLRLGRVTVATRSELMMEHDGVDIYRRPRYVAVPRMPFRNALTWSLGGLRLLKEYIAVNGRPDLVHAHAAINAGVLAAMIKTRFGIPYVLTEHSIGFAQGRLRWWERVLVRYAARPAHKLFAVSPDLAKQLEGRFGKGWIYLPNILGAPYLEGPDTVSQPPAGDTFTFICAGRLSPEKNHALLLRAFAAAFADDSSVRLALAGNGPSQPDLRALADELGIAGRLDFLGVLPPPQMREAMRQADAFAFSSNHETFGVVVIEAQSVGLPGVATASGGPDHMIDASNGLLVPVGDVDALRDALREMRRNAGRYDRAAIRATTLDRYGAQTFARDFDRLAL